MEKIQMKIVLYDFRAKIKEENNMGITNITDKHKEEHNKIINNIKDTLKEVSQFDDLPIHADCIILSIIITETDIVNLLFYKYDSKGIPYTPHIIYGYNMEKDTEDLLSVSNITLKNTKTADKPIRFYGSKINDEIYPIYIKINNDIKYADDEQIEGLKNKILEIKLGEKNLYTFDETEKSKLYGYFTIIIKRSIDNELLADIIHDHLRFIHNMINIKELDKIKDFFNEATKGVLNRFFEQIRIIPDKLIYKMHYITTNKIKAQLDRNSQPENPQPQNEQPQNEQPQSNQNNPPQSNQNNPYIKPALITFGSIAGIIIMLGLYTYVKKRKHNKEDKQNKN